jgi:hypothetical protein
LALGKPGKKKSGLTEKNIIDMKLSLIFSDFLACSSQDEKVFTVTATDLDLVKKHPVDRELLVLDQSSRCRFRSL